LFGLVKEFVMTVRVSSPGELVSMIPSLLGFSPQDSLVVLLFAGEGSLVCTMRVDLNTPVVEVSRRIVDLAAREHVTGIVCAVYAESTQWRESAGSLWLDEILADVLTVGVRGMDALLVVDGRWWSLFCERPDCCPPDGHVIADVAMMSLTRQQVEDTYALQEPVDESLVDTPSGLSLFDQCRLAVTLLPQTGSDLKAAGDVIGLVQDVRVRDWVLSQIVDDERLIEMVVHLALRTPAVFRPILAGLAAAALAAQGDNPVGTRAMLDYAGDDSLGILVGMSVDLAYSPRVLRDLIASSVERLVDQIHEADIACA
jgi:Domain of unknown function (DUF4192)